MAISCLAIRRSWSQHGRFVRMSIAMTALATLIAPRTASALTPATPTTPASTQLTSPFNRVAVNLMQTGPLRFEPNEGQAPAKVRYVAHAPDGLWVFTDHAVTLVVPSRTGAHVIRMTPVGVSSRSTVIAENPLPGQVNYFTGSGREYWHRNIPIYGQVRYRSVYPGIDLVFRGQGATMEYRWIIAPGADPNRVTMRVQGAEKLRLATNGTISSGNAAISESPARIYQIINGKRHWITGRVLLRNRNDLTLAVGPYDPREAIIVDPKLTYTAVLSGSLDDSAAAVAVDRAGDAYVTGATQSDDFPTQGAIQSGFQGGTDAFVAKLDPSGKLIYSTYLGGVRDDLGEAIAVDSAGDVFVAGQTDSKNFPTTPEAFQTQYNGGTCPLGGNTSPCTDAFVTKIDPSGARLIYSTLIGGKLADWAQGIALDGQGNAVVVGSTYSPNFPTVHAFRGALSALTCGQYDVIYPCPDAFVTKLNATGTGLIFSTLLGGKDDDEATAVAVAGDGTISVTGDTYSTDFPIVHGMKRVQRTRCKVNFGSAGRCPKAFVATLAADGSSLRYSSYLGGSNSNYGEGIAVDGSGNVYVVGETRSSDFPLLHPVQPLHYKGNCHDVTDSGKYPCPDAFITKIDVRTGKMKYSSHVGGTAFDGAAAVTIDSHGDAYVAGYAGSYNFPTLHAVQKKTGGGEDAFILELAPSGSKAYFITYLGGEHDDYATGIALGTTGDVYVAGYTDSPKFPKSVKYGAVPRGNDAFVVRLQPGTLMPAPLPCALLFGDKKTGCVKSK